MNRGCPFTDVAITTDSVESSLVFPCCCMCSLHSSPYSLYRYGFVLHICVPMHQLCVQASQAVSRLAGLQCLCGTVVLFSNLFVHLLRPFSPIANQRRSRLPSAFWRQFLTGVCALLRPRTAPRWPARGLLQRFEGFYSGVPVLQQLLG